MKAKKDGVFRPIRKDHLKMNSLIEENTNLVWSIARRFMGRGHDLDDLFQTGCLGLVKAASRFDSTMGNQFSTYAVPVITGEILKLFREDGAIKVSRSLKSLASKIKKQREIFEQQYGKEPTVSELASLIGVSNEDIAEAMNANAGVVSLDQPVSHDQEDGATKSDMVETSGWGSENNMIDRIQVNEILRTLKGLERKVIVLRFLCDQSQQQTADRLGLTQVTVSRLEKKIKNILLNEYKPL